MVKLCKDGRIWGQNNKSSFSHLGVSVRNKKNRKYGRVGPGCSIPKEVDISSFLNIGKCQLCYKQNKLLIHHKDENHQNNSLHNLVLLCRGCHNKVHIRNKVGRKTIVRDSLGCFK
jgi:5-methylcytosine-specific restriction endonuclease McrA